MRHKGGEGLKLEQYSVEGKGSAVKTPTPEQIANEKAFQKSTKGLFDTSLDGVNKSPFDPVDRETGKLKLLGKGRKSRRGKSRASRKTKRRGNF